MKHFVELDEKDLQCLIGEKYNIPEDEWDERIEINLGMTTHGYGMGEHEEPYINVKVFLP